MSFLHLFLVLCIFYTLCSILYKWYKRKKALDNLEGTELLQALDDQICGLVFVNKIGEKISLKIEMLENNSVKESHYFALESSVGKLPCYVPASLRICIADDNCTEIFVHRVHHEYVIVIDSDYRIYCNE